MMTLSCCWRAVSYTHLDVYKRQVLQAQSQLKAIYKDNADTIIGNMDTSIFLGGKEPTTLKELAAVLGKETIDTYNTGESRGRETSHSLNYQKLGKELMSQDEMCIRDRLYDRSEQIR